MPFSLSSFPERLEEEHGGGGIVAHQRRFLIGWLFFFRGPPPGREPAPPAETTPARSGRLLEPALGDAVAYESVSHGTCSRSATSVTPRVNELSQEPMRADLSP